jgi:hypothetical protein
MVVVREDYGEYSPPRWVRPTVERLLASLSEQHVGGLAEVVLTDAVTADTRKARRMRRSRHGKVWGRYHHAWSGNRAWIEIVVDRIVLASPKYLAWIQFVHDLTLGYVLFHEVGHHLDATVGAPARAGEPAAEAWQQRLFALHFAKRYWYLKRVVPLMRGLARFMARRERRRAAARCGISHDG